MAQQKSATTTVKRSPKSRSKKAAAPAHSSAGVIVLQWLTYAFWGWLIVGLIWLLSVILLNAIMDEPTANAVPYAIAASVVVLPLAFLCDLFYRKREPAKKAGGAGIVLILHTVVYALLGIGALIIAIFTALNLAINTGENKPQLITLAVAGFAACMYALTFLRTLNPFNTKFAARLYSYGMLVVTLGLLLFTITGPLASSIATRDDRRIEENIANLQYAIDEYTMTHNQLPDSLDNLSTELEYTDEAKRLVNDGVVTYKKEHATTEQDGSDTVARHHYQLCAEFTHERKADEAQNDSYRSFTDFEAHGAGEVCFKLTVDI